MTFRRCWVNLTCLWYLFSKVFTITSNPEIPTVEELIDCLLRVPSSTTSDSHIVSEAFVIWLIVEAEVVVEEGSSSGCGRGGREGLHYTYCKLDGHIQDRCFSLHSFQTKTANFIQFPTLV